jgi:hypothetical protein
MCTAVNHVLLRRFTGLFNGNLSAVKINLRNFDEKLKYRKKNSELIDNDFRIKRGPLT